MSRSRRRVAGAAAAAVAATAPAAALAASGPPAPSLVLAPNPPVVVPALAPPPGPHAEENRLVQLGLPEPARLAVGTPSRAAAEWLTAWHQRAWGRLRVWTTPVPDAATSAARLRARWWVARLDGWALREVVQRGATGTARVVVAIHPALRDVERRATIVLPLRRRGGVWQVEARAVATPLAGAMA